MILLRGRLGWRPRVWVWRAREAHSRGWIARWSRDEARGPSSRETWSRRWPPCPRRSTGGGAPRTRYFRRPEVAGGPAGRCRSPGGDRGGGPLGVRSETTLYASGERVIRSLAAAKRAVERSSASSRDRRGEGWGGATPFHPRSPLASARTSSHRPRTRHRRARRAETRESRPWGWTAEAVRPRPRRSPSRRGLARAKLGTIRRDFGRTARRFPPVADGKNPRNSREPNSRAPRSRSRTESAPAR